MGYVVISCFVLLICMNLIATWKIAGSSKHSDWAKRGRDILAVWALPILGAPLLIEEHSDFKQRFAEKLRERVYPRLIELGFETKRPNGKYAGRFPVNHFRERDGVLDLLSFVWRTRGRPTMVIALERISDPAGILDFRDQGWNAETFRYRDFGGRVAERGSVFGPKWYGLRWRYYFLPRRIQDFAMDRQIRTVMRRLDEVDAFLRGGPPPAGFCEFLNNELRR